MLKIGVDLHGVLNKHPATWKQALELLRRMGKEVHVMSGPPTEQIQKELDDLGFKKGIHYDHIMSVVDWLKFRGVETWLEYRCATCGLRIGKTSALCPKCGASPEGEWWCDDKDWWLSKGDYCRENEIEVCYDNSEKYRSNMPSSTKFMLSTN